jgi:hypothetical protein
MMDDGTPGRYNQGAARKESAVFIMSRRRRRSVTKETLSYREFLEQQEAIIAKFIDALDGTEGPDVIVGASFNLINIVLCHLRPSSWDAAEHHVRDCTAALIRKMRAGEESAAVH